jgi:preprotein translocase subunit SecD
LAPPSGNVSRPGRALAVLAALIVVMFQALVGGNIGSPGQWGKDFKVHLGLDLTSGTTVALRAQAPKGVSSAQFAADMTQAKNIMANRVNGRASPKRRSSSRAATSSTSPCPARAARRW